MTYPEVLGFLFSQLPMYQRVGKTAFKKDLSNTIKLCKSLGNPQDQFPSIHIAGTNGKGSTAHMIASILQAKGLRVGLYTSPHYRDYRERVKINGTYIAKSKVIEFVENNRETIESIKPSFFEMTVGLAFDYFAKQNVDIAVIETGLGGRLDSTNIITPLITAITNIGLDHQVLLGDSIPLIAYEKAGIIKDGIPCIVGTRQEETKEVFAKVASTKNTSVVYAKDFITIEVLNQQIHQSDINVSVEDKAAYKVEFPSGVAYNIENCRTAIASIHTLNKISDFSISKNHIQDGLRNFPDRTKYMGRWQIKSKTPTILLDAAHNEDGIKGLFVALNKYDFDKIHIILGMVRDKDTSKILTLLPKDARYYFCKPEIPRGKDANELQSEGKEFNLQGRSYVSCKNALKAAKRASGERDLILGTGSSFVVAELV